MQLLLPTEPKNRATSVAQKLHRGAPRLMTPAAPRSARNTSRPDARRSRCSAPRWRVLDVLGQADQHQRYLAPADGGVVQPQQVVQRHCSRPALPREPLSDGAQAVARAARVDLA